MMQVLRRVIVVALALALAPVALASTHLRQASIADGAWLDISPFSVTLVFNERVTLRAMWLADRYGARIPIRLSSPQGVQIAAALPVLVPHHYRLHWSGTNARGETVESDLRFAIRGCEEREGTEESAWDW